MNFKVGDIVRGNQLHINHSRQFDRGVVSKVEDNCVWVVWLDQEYSLQFAYADELKLLWRDGNNTLQ